MPKDDERKEMTQEELDAREEKFRTFFTTSVAQVPEEMTRRDDENEEKPKSLLGRLFRREKAEQQEGGTPEESRTGEIQLGGEEPEDVEPPDAMTPISRLQWEHIQQALHETGGNVSAAARLLGMHRRSLQRKLTKRPSPERDPNR